MFRPEVIEEIWSQWRKVSKRVGLHDASWISVTSKCNMYIYIYNIYIYMCVCVCTMRMKRPILWDVVDDDI